MFKVMMLVKAEGVPKRAIQVGAEVDTLQRAIKRAFRVGGYVVGPDKKLHAQAISPSGPKFIKCDIASGEDVVC